MSESQGGGVGTMNDNASEAGSSAAFDKFGHLLRFPEEIHPVYIELTDEQQDRRKVRCRLARPSRTLLVYSLSCLLLLPSALLFAPRLCRGSNAPSSLVGCGAAHNSGAFGGFWHLLGCPFGLPSPLLCPLALSCG